MTGREEKDREWRDYPIGTKAHACTGGHWCKTKGGWKWNGPGGTGGTFPTPGGDAVGDCVELPPYCPRFSYVDVVAPAEAKGTLNLIFDHYPVAWINNLYVAAQIREYLNRQRVNREDSQ